MKVDSAKINLSLVNLSCTMFYVVIDAFIIDDHIKVEYNRVMIIYLFVCLFVCLFVYYYYYYYYY